MFPCPPEAQRLLDPCRDEAAVVAALQQRIQGRIDWTRAAGGGCAVGRSRARTRRRSGRWNRCCAVPDQQQRGPGFDAPCREPAAGAGHAHGRRAHGRPTGPCGFDTDGDGPHKLLAALASSAIQFSKQLRPARRTKAACSSASGADRGDRHRARHPAAGPAVRARRSIAEAQAEAAAARREATQLRFSFDMLGEGARTEADAERYLASYAAAPCARWSGNRAPVRKVSDGISIKPSALFSRYEVLARVSLPRCCRAWWQPCSSAVEADSTLNARCRARLSGWSLLDVLTPLVTASRRRAPGGGAALVCGAGPPDAGARGHRAR